jgi:putative peptidoglycan lipid II flippase
MLPAALGLLVLAPNILSAIYEWGGNFNDNSTLLSARALMFYAPGLVVFSAAKVFVPAFYAMKDTRTPVRIGIYTVLLNLIMNIVFILALPEYWKHAGMAFSTVTAEAVGMAALGILLSRRIENIQWKKIGQGMIRHTISAIAMALIVWMTATVVLPILGKTMSSKFAQLATVGLAMAIGAFTYFICALALKVPELREIKAALSRKR